jgi:hypothetical protein
MIVEWRIEAREASFYSERRGPRRMGEVEHGDGDTVVERVGR